MIVKKLDIIFTSTDSDLYEKLIKSLKNDSTYFTIGDFRTFFSIGYYSFLKVAYFHKMSEDRFITKCDNECLVIENLCSLLERFIEKYNKENRIIINISIDNIPIFNFNNIT